MAINTEIACAARHAEIMPDELAEIIATHTALFGGFTMMADQPGDDTPDDDGDGNAEQESDAEGDDDLGDAGKRALNSERRARKKAERRSAELQAELDRIADADKTELERANDRATQAEQERDDLQNQLDTLRIEQAVYRLAGNANPAALLDSRAFTESLADIEPDDDRAIAAAIKDALKANPLLGRNRSSGDLHEGQRQASAPNSTAPGVHRMAAAFDAHLGNTP